MEVAQIADEMYKMVADAAGKRNLKAGDLTKAIVAAHPEVSKDECKKAIRELMDSGRCVYGYFGGSYIQLPHKEAAEK